MLKEINDTNTEESYYIDKLNSTKWPEIDTTSCGSIKGVKSSYEVYLKLQGSEYYPFEPANLPGIVYLPSDLTNPLAEEITSCQIWSKERAQAVGRDSMRGEYIFGEKFHGKWRSVETATLDYEINDKSIYKRKHLLNFHTHPNGSFFSGQDIGGLFASPEQHQYYICTFFN